MKFLLLPLSLLLVAFCLSAQGLSTSYLQEKLCSSEFLGDVTSYAISDGSQEIGYSIWLNRKSQHVKAKYFAHKDVASGEIVNDRYNSWRSGRNIILMSSGAYATGWNGSNVPAGLTIDDGNIVNRTLDNTMDGLVIVEAVGGIRVSNIEDGDLRIGTSNGFKAIDVRSDKAEFFSWAQQQKATVFQTHLLAYKNQLMISEYTSAKDRSIRKVLVLVESPNGDIFHIIYYTRFYAYSLYEVSEKIINHLKMLGHSVIAAINLDTGAYDVMATNDVIKVCKGKFIKGSSNESSEMIRGSMSNMLIYEYNH